MEGEMMKDPNQFLKPITPDYADMGDDLPSSGAMYKIDLRMANLKKLPAQLIKTLSKNDRSAPTQIVLIDMSVNNLREVSGEDLHMLPALRQLDLSMNEISQFTQLRLLGHLNNLNASHNGIISVESIAECIALNALDISNNRIKHLEPIGLLINLRVLRVHKNQLESLHGVQFLASLRELYVQENLITIISPLATCFHLLVLDISENKIKVLGDVVDTLRGLKRLRYLKAYGNPMERDESYRTKLETCLHLHTLDDHHVGDHQTVLPSTQHHQTDKKHKMDPFPFDGFLRDVTSEDPRVLLHQVEQAYAQHIRESRRRCSEVCRHYQEKITRLQREQEGYEQSLDQNYQDCLRFLQRLTGPGTRDDRAPAERKHGQRGQQRREDRSDSLF